jgi:hypothetical protein
MTQSSSCRSELHKNRDFLNVDLVDVKDFNPRLGANLEERPSEYLPLVSSPNAIGHAQKMPRNHTCSHGTTAI